MKTIPLSLIVATLIAPMTASAQPPGDRPQSVPGQGENKKGQRRSFEEVWKAADKDHDGFLSPDEFAAMPRIQNLTEERRQHVFKRLDKDGDGRLSREELAPMAEPRDDQNPPLGHLWELDVDKSGGISFEEFKTGAMIKKLSADRQAELFRRLDTNHDGLITPEDKPEHPFKREGVNPMNQHMDPNQLIRRLDQNADGALSFEEFRAGWMVRDLSESQQKAIFATLDANHDGKLTLEDFTPPPAPAGEPPPPEKPAPSPVIK